MSTCALMLCFTQMCAILTKKYGRAPVLNMPGDEAEAQPPAPAPAATVQIVCVYGYASVYIHTPGFRRVV